MKRIAMLSTHGYFDPKPILGGATDTGGGQVVYVLELAKALARRGGSTKLISSPATLKEDYRRRM